jgi:cytochrome c peroxidase
LED